MIIIDTSKPRVMATPNAAIDFDELVIRTGGAEQYISGKSVRLHRIGIYEIHFHANVRTSFDYEASLVFRCNDEVLPHTLMTHRGGISTVSAVTLVENKAKDGMVISVIKPFDQPIYIDRGASLFVKRVA